MANKYIVPVYKTVFSEDFDYSIFDKRMQMQKTIYLLEQMGVSIGDYGFTWYKHGPYSQQLLDDMYQESGSHVKQPNYTTRATQALHKLKDEFNKARNYGFPYSMASWVECIASLHYLKANILPPHTSKENVLRELVERKPHLSNKQANELAYSFVLTIV